MTTPASQGGIRGSGLTTLQMKQAPENAIFVVSNRGVDYATKLARFLGRGDLLIRSAEWINRGYGEALRGLDVFVMLDHALDIPVRTAYLMTEHNRRWEMEHGRPMPKKPIPRRKIAG